MADPGRDRAQDPHHLSAQPDEAGPYPPAVLWRRVGGRQGAGLRPAASCQPVRDLRRDPAASALPVHAGQRRVLRPHLHSRAGLSRADRHRRDSRQLLGVLPEPAARPLHRRSRLSPAGHAAAGAAWTDRRGEQDARSVDLLPRQAQPVRRAATGGLRRGTGADLGRCLERQRQRTAEHLPPVRQRLGAQGPDRRRSADAVVDGLPTAGAHLLWSGGQLRRLRQCFPPGADPPVLRPDPQWRRAEFPPPDARGGAPAIAR
ncbi:hypothetical protein D3C78_1060730 [compost metagenome]